MYTPTVSVIVTVFNRTEFLAVALQSVLDQTCDDYEIIVTDDSASDPIRAICESFGNDRIRYRRNVDRLGVALNLRAAVSEARGRYIAILNDDDLWEPEFLEKLVAPLEEDPARGLAFCDHWLIDANGVIDAAATDANTAYYGRADLPRGEVARFDEHVLMRNGVPLAMGSVFRVDAIDWSRVVPEVSGAYDFWISCLLASSGARAFYVPERLTRYRTHQAMETARKAPDKNENLVYIYKTLLRLDAFPRYRDELARRHAHALFLVGKDNLRFNRKRQAQDLLRNSLKISFDAKAFVLLCLSYLPSSLLFAVLKR